jgi:hypothetical protein
MVLAQKQTREIDQGNKIEDPGINALSYGHPILDKDAKNVCWKNACSTNVSGGTAYPYLFLILYKTQFKMD